MRQRAVQSWQSWPQQLVILTYCSQRRALSPCRALLARLWSLRGPAATVEMAWLNPFANPTRPVLPAPSPGVRTRVGEPNILNNNVFARPAPATPRPEPKRARGAAPTPLSRRLVLHETPDRPLDEIEESETDLKIDYFFIFAPPWRTFKRGLLLQIT